MKLRTLFTGSAGLILAAGFFTLFISSARFAIGLTLRPMVDDLNWTRTDIGQAVAVFQVITAFAMYVGGQLADTVSARLLLGWGIAVCGVSIGLMSQISEPWHVLILFGLIYACANGVASTSVVSVMVTRAFPGNAGTANGVVTAGVSVGQLVIISVLAAVLVAIGWRSVFVWIGLIHVLFIPFIAYAAPGPDNGKVQNAPRSTEGMSLREAMATRQFWLLIIIFAICGFNDFFVTTHVVAFAQDRGVDTLLAGNLLAVIGIVGLIGVLAAGYWGDKFGPVSGTALTFAARVAVFLLLLFDQSTLSIVIFVLVFGLTFLATAPLTILFVRDSFGLKNLGAIGGVIVMVHHICGGFGAWLGARVFDTSGTYTYAFASMMAASIVALVVTLVYQPFKKLPESSG